MSHTSFEAQKGVRELTHYVRATSIQAYEKVKGELSERQRDVLTTLLEMDEAAATRRMITEKMDGVVHSSVVPRVNELIDMSLVEEIGKSSCQVTGETAYYLQPTINRGDN